MWHPTECCPACLLCSRQRQSPPSGSSCSSPLSWVCCEHAAGTRAPAASPRQRALQWTMPLCRPSGCRFSIFSYFQVAKGTSRPRHAFLVLILLLSFISPRPVRVPTLALMPPPPTMLHTVSAQRHARLNWCCSQTALFFCTFSCLRSTMPMIVPLTCAIRYVYACCAAQALHCSRLLCGIAFASFHHPLQVALLRACPQALLDAICHPPLQSALAGATCCPAWSCSLSSPAYACMFLCPRASSCLRCTLAALTAWSNASPCTPCLVRPSLPASEF